MPRPRGLRALLLFLLLTSTAEARLLVPELSHVCTLYGGELCRGVIKLVNVGEEALAVDVRQADYVFDADGSNRYPPAGSEERSNADWISLQPAEGRVTIAPDSTFNIAYTVRVPADAQLTGTYWSVVLLDPVPAPQGAHVAHGVRITHGIGYGVQLVTHIGDTGLRAVELQATSITHTHAGANLLVDLVNTGERSLRPVVQAAVHLPSGEPVGTFHSGRRHIFPGCSVRYRLRLTGLERGAYLIALIVDNLDEYVWAADMSVKLE